MRETDRVCAQLLDDPGVVIMILPRQRTALVQLILMTADTAQRRRNTIQYKALVRIARKTPDTHARADRVIRLIASLQHRGDSIQVRIVAVPQSHIRHKKLHCRAVRRADAVPNLSAVRVADAVLDREVLVRVHHPGFQRKLRAAALCRCRCDLESIAAPIHQFEMYLRDTDQVQAAVKPAVESEVRGLRVHVALVLIAARDHQKILAILTARIRDIRAESGVAALVIADFLPVHIHGCLLPCRRDIHKDPPAWERLSRCPECPRIPAAASGIAAVSVVTVHRIPSVRQIHHLPVFRELVRKSRVLLDEPPASVEIDNSSHVKSSFRFALAIIVLLHSICTIYFITAALYIC